MQQYISEIILTSVLGGNKPGGYIEDLGEGTRFFYFLGCLAVLSLQLVGSSAW